MWTLRQIQCKTHKTQKYKTHVEIKHLSNSETGADWTTEIYNGSFDVLPINLMAWHDNIYWIGMAENFIGYIWHSTSLLH